MKILNVTYERPKFHFYDKGLIELADDLEIKLKTDEGVLRLFFKAGAIFDGCSTPWFLRPLLKLPKYGKEKYAIAWLAHDFLFDTHGLSFGLANDIFRELLIWSGKSIKTANLAHFGVDSWIGKRHYHKKQDKINVGKLHFRWDAK